MDALRRYASRVVLPVALRGGCSNIATTLDVSATGALAVSGKLRVGLYSGTPC